MDKNTFPCSACGAQLAYQPGAEHLICDKCGTEQPIPDADGHVQEYDLKAALAGANQVDPRSIAENATEVRCEGCGAVSVLTGTADRCAFCDSPVVIVDDDTSILKPESVLPFAIDQKAAGAKFKDWIGSRWFAPNDLVQRSQQEAIDGVYLPYFTFDSDTLTFYKGERGEHYYEEVPDEDADGNPTTRKVRKTDWTDTQGVLQRDFDDILVCATKSLPRNLTERLEPWDLDALKPFEPSYLAGFQAERYGVGLDESWGFAQERMESHVRSDVRDDIGGDEQKIHQLALQHRQVTFKHTLLPLWISSYRYEGEVYRVIVNARTGAVSGDRPYSKFKLAMLVLAIAGLAFFICGGFSCCSGTVGMTQGG